MANRWTPAQQEALDTRNKNLLLSAAAGSGKTAVLTERITRIAGDMESGIDINELLVLTFTKAAAAEMKSRVSASLTNKLREADAENNLPLIHHLERQLSLMGSAQISRSTPSSSRFSASTSTSSIWIPRHRSWQMKTKDTC